MVTVNKLSLVPDIVTNHVVSVTLLKYAVMNEKRPPSYNVIRVTLNRDHTVREENPLLPYVWDGKWWFSERVGDYWLNIQTGHYFNMINLDIEDNGIYTADEFYGNMPTGVTYQVVFAEIVLIAGT